MNTEEKNEFDAIFALQEMTWNRINNRQGAEWKLTISLWSVLSIFIGTLITGKISILQSPYTAIIIVLGIAFICVLYILNLIKVSKFQIYQLTRLSDFDKRLFMLSDVITSDITKTRLSEFEKYRKINVYLALRVGITLLLLVSTLLAVYMV